MTLGSQARLPLEPFRAWLVDEVEKRGWDAVASQCSVSERQLFRVMHETKRWVSIDLVDQCLLNSSTRLDDLYPLEDS